MSDTSSCLECGRPWGVILERGEEPSDERQRLAQMELEDELRDYLDESADNEVVFDFSTLAKCCAQRIVFVTEKLADFASDRFGSYVGESPAWYRIDDCDIPRWLLKGRAQRWAYLWDCCDLDLGRFYEQQELVAVLTTEGEKP